MTTRKVSIRMPTELYDYANNKSQAKRTSVSKEIVDIIYTHKHVEECVGNRPLVDAGILTPEEAYDFTRCANRQLDGVIECMKPEPRLSFWRRVLRFVGGK